MRKSPALICLSSSSSKAALLALTTMVLTGSLCDASRIASIAVARSTPSISNRIRPGRTHRDPSFGCALALAHAGFGRLLGKRLVREHPNPHAAAALDMARQRDTGGFERARVDTAGLDAFEPVVAEGELDAAVFGAA